MDSIRNFFIFSKIDQKSACKVEGCKVKIKGKHITNLENHVRRFHPNEYKKYITSAKKKKNLQTTTKSRNKLTIVMSKETLEEACIEMVTLNGLPFSAIDCSGLRKLIDPIQDALGNYKINQSNVKHKISAKAESIRAEIKKEVQDKVVSIKIDGLDIRNRCFLGIHLQYVRDTFLLLTTLSLVELKERHTGEYLKRVILQQFDLFGIKLKQLYSVGCDNAKNMIKCVKLLRKDGTEVLTVVYDDEEEEDDDEDEDEAEDENEDEDEDEVESESEGVNEHEDEDECKGKDEDKADNDNEENENENAEIPETFQSELENFVSQFAGEYNLILVMRCLAHSLQLCINDALKTRKKSINRARSLVKKLRNKCMRRILKRLGLNLPIIDIETRWSSTFYMLERLLSYTDYFNQISSENEKISQLVKKIDWNLINKFVETLEPAAIATKQLQSEQLSPSEAYLIWRNCENKLGSIDTALARDIVKNMESRNVKLKLFKNPVFIAALYLDPRFCHSLEEDQVNVAKKHLVELHNKILEIKENKNDMDFEEDSSSTQENQSVVISEEDENFDIDLEIMKEITEKEKLAKQPQTSCSAMSERKENIRNFINSLENFKLPTVHFNDKKEEKAFNILHFWEKLKNKYPQIHEVAICIHAAPATQVSVEQLFSHVHYILSPQRNRMKSQLLEDVMITRMYYMREIKRQKIKN